MRSQLPRNERGANVGLALGFILSGLLAVAFAGLVNKTHDWFASTPLPESTWHLARVCVRCLVGA